MTSDYNCHYASAPTTKYTWAGAASLPDTLAQWVIDSGQDGNSVEGDPLFDANYNLGAGSPAIGTADPISGISKGLTNMGAR